MVSRHGPHLSSGPPGCYPGLAVHVLLYTYSTCSFCARAKALLDRRGMPYTERVLDGDRDTLARLAKLFGASAMPYVMVDGEPVGGLAELERMDRDGELGAGNRD